MGEMYPPTAADYAAHNASTARDNAARAQAKADSLEKRVNKLEADLAAVYRLLKSVGLQP